MFILIAAAATNNAIGKDNQLLWHLPNDFKHFKTLTTGHYIIMGRKTFESFPKPLPNRTHIIITRQKNYSAPEDCIVVQSLDEALNIPPKNEDVYIIGGGEIYKQAMPIAHKIILTRVETSFDADTFFPNIDPSLWKLDAAEKHYQDEKHLYNYSFLTYTKK